MLLPIDSLHHYNCCRITKKLYYLFFILSNVTLRSIIILGVIYLKHTNERLLDLRLMRAYKDDRAYLKQYAHGMGLTVHELIEKLVEDLKQNKYIIGV